MDGKNGDPRYVPKREPLEYSDDRVYCSERWIPPTPIQ